jgi:hypothetical protein
MLGRLIGDELWLLQIFDDSLLMALNNDFHYSIPAHMNGGEALTGKRFHDVGCHDIDVRLMWLNGTLDHAF